MKARFLTHIKAELLKCRRMKVPWIIVLASAMPSLLTFFTIHEHKQTFVPYFKRDPWDLLVMMTWHDAVIIIIPLFIMLITSFIVHIEYRNLAYRQVFIQPRSYTDIYLTKFIVIQCMIILLLIGISGCILLEAWLLEKTHLAGTFTFNTIPVKLFVKITFRIYISMMAISAIQYWLSWKFRVFIVPVISGLVLLITAPAMASFGLSLYDPYMYPRLLFSAGIKGYKYAFSFSTLLIAALGGFLMILLGGLFHFSRAKVKG